METGQQNAGAQGLLERLLRGGALLGGVVLFVIMALVSAAVFFRYVLNAPILGDKELVEIGMSLVVMLAMPYTAHRGAHIRVDILDGKLGSFGRFIGDIFARGVGVFVLVLLIGKTWDKALDAYEYEVTNMIEIPVWIPYGAITFGMGLFALVLALQLLLQFRQGPRRYE